MVATGLSEEVFWSSTPRQTYRAIKAADGRFEADERLRRWHTWHRAALPLLKKFPEFEDFQLKTAAPTPTRRQTMEEQIAIARKWSAAVSAKKK